MTKVRHTTKGMTGSDAAKSLGRRFQAIVDLRKDVVPKQSTPAAEFIAQRVIEHPDRASLAKSGGRYLAFCGRTPHVSLGFMVHEKAEIGPEIDKAISLHAKRSGEALPITRFNIRLRLGQNRSKLQQWLESEQESRKADVGESEEIESAVTSLRKTIRAIVGKLPKSYDERRSVLVALSDAFREEVGRSLGPAINERLAGMPKETYDEKKALARYVNAELRRFGLAARCPKTGRASILQADYGRHPEHGRFQMDNVDDEGRRDRSLSFNDLIPLELVPDDLSRASWGKWAGEERAKASKRTRG